MAETENLTLPLLEAGQAQKHVTLNEALRLLDAMVQLAVTSVASTPPASPDEGARYIVGAGASGGWSGHEDDIALRRDGAWMFVAPRAGFVAFNQDTGRLLFYADGGDGWIDLFAEAALDNVARVGVATTADATNRLSVRAPAVLHTAVYASDGGSGDAQFKLNKEAAGDTASLLFQSNFSGRAEIGLVGDDDLHLKVSADGAAWTGALTIGRTNGHLGLGAAPDSGSGSAILTSMITDPAANWLSASAIFDSSTNGIGFAARRARGTPASPTAMLAGDRFFGYYGSGYHSGGAWGANVVAFQGVAEENLTGSAQGTRLDFATTAVGAASRRTIVQFRANGTLHLVPASSAPSSPENGQIYYDSTLGKFRGYAAGAWADLN